MISINNLTVMFNELTPLEKIVLNNFNLKINDNDFITILGSNGAGKSTLFNSILGSVEYSGTIDINGEEIDMKDYEKKNEELLLKLAKQDELKNKRLITDMWVLTITAFIFYLALIGVSCSLLEEGPILATIVCISTVILLVVCFYGFKLEVDAGYYECRRCHHVFEEKNYFKLLMAPHMGTSRYQKCPKCGKRSMAKKVMYKKKGEI